MFISPAYAQAATDAAAGNPIMGVVFQFVLIFAVFYFLLIRPQSQKAKQHSLMLENIKRGDVVVTSGGLIAKVAKELANDELLVEISEGVKVKVLRRTVRDALDKEGNSLLEPKQAKTQTKEEKPKESSAKAEEEKAQKVDDSKKGKKSEALKKALSD
jgi:preprotein translocase subunit YajC